MSAKKFKILITGNLAPYALSFLKNAPSLTVQYEPSLSGPALETAISDADGLIIRTDTKVTKDLLDHAPQLRAICRAGMGVDQIDIASCIQKKITVMNTPEANRVSAAEHTFALLLALAKKIPKQMSF